MDTNARTARTAYDTAEDAQAAADRAEDQMIRLENEARAAHAALDVAGDALASALDAAGTYAERDVDTFTITAESGWRIVIAIDIYEDGPVFALAVHSPNPADAPVAESAHGNVPAVVGNVLTWQGMYGEV